MSKYLMALDQGTTSSRCIIFTQTGEIKSTAQKEYTQIFPREGWVEHDPMEIWSSQLAVMAEAMAKVGLVSTDIAALGITNQRETTVVWDKTTGKPIYNAIVWQCRRTADDCQALMAQGLAPFIQERTGLRLDAYFSATKLRWILEYVPGARAQAEAGNLLFGTVDTWLVWQLTNGQVHATDYSNASRTMLFNIHTLTWDKDILRTLNIPENMLPTVLPSSHMYGQVHHRLPGAGIPISGIAGDQQAALFGQCCFQPGMVKNTYGTGCFTLMFTGKQAVKSQNGLLTTIAWGIDGQVEYALEGSVFIGGAAIQWLRDGLRMIDSAVFTEVYAEKVQDTGGVYMVPAFVGLGAPYWNQDARGTIVGITRGTTKDHFIRAAVEAIAYQSYDVITAMASDFAQEKEKCTPIQIKVDGGASNNNFLMQFQADILDGEVLRPHITESTALGAAFLAGLTVGMYKNREDIAQKVQLERIFTPSMAVETRQQLLRGWKQAVKMCNGA